MYETGATQSAGADGTTTQLAMKSATPPPAPPLPLTQASSTAPTIVWTTIPNDEEPAEHRGEPPRDA